MNSIVSLEDIYGARMRDLAWKEGHRKGFPDVNASHSGGLNKTRGERRREEVLKLLTDKPQTTLDIADKANCATRTAFGHLQKLADAGLAHKEHGVLHTAFWRLP